MPAKIERAKVGKEGKGCVLEGGSGARDMAGGGRSRGSAGILRLAGYVGGQQNSKGMTI